MSTMVDFDSRPIAAELLCNKYLANVTHVGHTWRLKLNLDLADPTEKMNLENWSQNSATKEIVAFVQ